MSTESARPEDSKYGDAGAKAVNPPKLTAQCAQQLGMPDVMYLIAYFPGEADPQLVLGPNSHLGDVNCPKKVKGKHQPVHGHCDGGQHETCQYVELGGMLYWICV